MTTISYLLVLVALLVLWEDLVVVASQLWVVLVVVASLALVQRELRVLWLLVLI